MVTNLFEYKYERELKAQHRAYNALRRDAEPPMYQGSVDWTETKANLVDVSGIDFKRLALELE